MSQNNSLYRGTLDLLVLRAVAREPLHGWGISQWLVRTSGGHISVPQGSLYPSLHRLERQGLLKAQWKQSPEGRKAKYYSLTRVGKKMLLEKEGRWIEYAEAVGRIIEAGRSC